MHDTDSSAECGAGPVSLAAPLTPACCIPAPTSPPTLAFPLLLSLLPLLHGSLVLLLLPLILQFTRPNIMHALLLLLQS